MPDGTMAAIITCIAVGIIIIAIAGKFDADLSVKQPAPVMVRAFSYAQSRNRESQSCDWRVDFLSCHGGGMGGLK